MQNSQKVWWHWSVRGVRLLSSKWSLVPVATVRSARHNTSRQDGAHMQIEHERASLSLAEAPPAAALKTLEAI